MRARCAEDRMTSGLSLKFKTKFPLSVRTIQTSARNSLQRAAIRSHVLEQEKGRSEFGPCSIHIDPLVWASELQGGSLMDPPQGGTTTRVLTLCFFVRSVRSRQIKSRHSTRVLLWVPVVIHPVTCDNPHDPKD